MLTRYIYTIAILSIAYTSVDIYAQQTSSPNTSQQQYAYNDFFNTKNISHQETAKAMLKQEKVYKCNAVETQDNAHLEVFARILDNPCYNVILPAGFSPGKLYGMTPFCKILDDNSNLFFFHARDRGNSRSPESCYNVWQYGRNHWQDVVAMLTYAHDQAPQKPTYILGVCSGAFHVLHAAYKLGDDLTTKYNVKGIIADSSMTSIHEMARTAIPGELTRSLDKRGYTWRAMLYRLGLHILRHMIYVPFTQRLEQDTRITPSLVQNVPVPICFIHGTQDPYSDISNIRSLKRDCDQLHEFSSRPKTSIHAVINLKYPQAYKGITQAFMQAQQSA